MVSFTEGTRLISPGSMTYKLTEMMKADPLGIGGTVDVGDVVEAGAAEIVYVRE